MTQAAQLEAPSWWASLNHGGMLIAPARLFEYLSSEFPPLPRHLADRLRRDLLRLRDGDADRLGALLDTVLEDVLGLERPRWRKGSDIDARWSHKAVTGEIIKPRRVWQSADGGVLPVFVAGSAMTGDRYAEAGHLGIGRGRRPVSRVIEWLRRSGEKIALLTNGRQWRLLHAGADYDAWCEWETDLWFEEGVPGQQVTALRILLGEPALRPPMAEEPPPLIAAILASRRGQAELSAALGERVRLGVELLIRESAGVLCAIDGDEPGQVSRRDLYIAATRLVMRCVVILFAEARDLLPRDNAIYHECYGVQGLREQLARLAGGRAERLRHSHSSWPRLLALFRLIQQGSPHEALPIPRYGGGLFAPGDRTSKAPVLRALAAFEDPRNAPTDAAIHEILELLCVSKVKLRQGRSSTWVPAPVDFSDLSSEYIGILYEGLLDFELHRAPEDDAVVFLRLGDEPALPLSRLEKEMAPKRLAELIGKLKKSTKKVAAAEGEDDDEEAEDAEEEEGEGAEEEAQPEEPALDEAVEAVVAEGEAAGFDIVREVRERAEIWAEKAVKDAKLVADPRSDIDPVVRDRWAEDVKKKARALYRLVLPGQWYLVRWGGTRKGAGTFYTRPQLAVPTARRALQPLCYEPAEQVKDEATGFVTVTKWVPHRPEDILALKVCDPAMGSGSFLVAALRYLTDALVESLHFYKRLHTRPDGAICKLADGLPLDHPSQETVPVPLDHPEFDERLRARLKRHVVERCIYGVDIDPLAVELARMALWVETMDRRLPFGFLDHKLRCGNSLVGCWFDRFQDYPVMAFERDDAGDKNHDRFVHHFREYTAQRGKKKGQPQRSGDVWTQRWQQVKDEVIKPEIRDVITGQLGLPFTAAGRTPEGIHDDALAAFNELHDLPVHEVDRREQLYRDKIADSPALVHLREAFDRWCAIWFWPGDALDLVLTPKNFHNSPEPTRAIVVRLREEHRFFHWELEFPDVFTGPGSGFDAIIGNPPWEIQKPISKEFFSNIDPLYRAYGKQEALRFQSEYFTRSEGIERDWLKYCARFKSLSTWSKYVAFPFGDAEDGEGRFAFTRSPRDNATLRDLWRRQPSRLIGYADAEHPLRHQGSADINTYKMFLEVAHAALRRGGRLAFIVPAAFYGDKGAVPLRTLFLSRARLTELYAFQNERRVFQGIHHAFKMCVPFVEKGAAGLGFRTLFSLGIAHSPTADVVEDQLSTFRGALPVSTRQVERFSPETRAILEIREQRDLDTVEKVYRRSVLLAEQGSRGWGIRYSSEFHMTNDSQQFSPRPAWEGRGYRPNELGLWVGPDGDLDVALPLYEGRSVGQFDFQRKGWISGKGRRAVWREIPWTEKIFEPQFLMAMANYLDRSEHPTRWKIAFMDVAASNVERTMIATPLWGAPCGNSAPTLTVRDGDFVSTLMMAGILNSFAYDFFMRRRCTGLHLNWFVISESPVPAETADGVRAVLAFSVAALALPHAHYAQGHLELRNTVPRIGGLGWRSAWAISRAERVRHRCIVDALVAHLYGLSLDDLRWILTDVDHPADRLAERKFASRIDSKTFWLTDKEEPPELRHTVLTLVAFHELSRIGLDAFLSLNDGDGWMLPETLRLTDYGLGHDDRAKDAQPVAARLGPRFLPWQLEQTPKASWEECERHAERLEALLGRPLATDAGKEPAPQPGASKPTDLFGEPLQTDLLGNVVGQRTSRGKRGR